MPCMHTRVSQWGLRTNRPSPVLPCAASQPCPVSRKQRCKELPRGLACPKLLVARESSVWLGAGSSP
eukprot:4701643-Lingulodinium_polyedra.AAC.1